MEEAPIIPKHNLDEDRHSVKLETIAHRNPYDFTKEHRHTYFEVMFFVKGGGINLIDFREYEVRDFGCYIIYPNQIHLLKRSEHSLGRVLQFNEESISSVRLLKILQERAWSGTEAILFEDQKLMAKMLPYLDLLEGMETGKFVEDSRRHLLQSVLFELFNVAEAEKPILDVDPELYRFQQLVDAHYRKEHTVRFYVSQLNVAEKKLSSLSKRYVGMTPLQIIHNRLLLESKRLLTFAEYSHKEIAYALGFNNPASFSSFVKKKTGITPSEIQHQIKEKHHKI